MKVIGIIPARYGSTRFEGKPLAEIAGKPMIQHVYERARQARLLEEVIVATDDERIRAAVEGFGGKVAMTRSDHPTGTDRLAEVAGGLDVEIVCNVQGDEPLIDPGAIDAAIQPLLDDPSIPMSTLMAPITEERDLNDPNCVKMVVDRDGFALYFSRSLIPYPRDGRTEGRTFYYHPGLYVYRREFLLTYAALPPAPLEQIESLEQLRALENGYRIKCVETGYRPVAVDTPEDLERVRALMGS